MSVYVEVAQTSTKDVVIYRTSDGGATWKSVMLPWKDEGLANLVGVQFVDAQHGYFTVGLGEATSRRPGFLFATIDGGASWLPIHHSANLTAVQWLGITGPSTGWAVVARGSAQAQLLTRANNETLLTTSDGGATWIPAA